ncbi:hypothetical protein D3C71_2179820 [compost metagenome]
MKIMVGTLDIGHGMLYGAIAVPTAGQVDAQLPVDSGIQLMEGDLLCSLGFPAASQKHQ